MNRGSGEGAREDEDDEEEEEVEGHGRERNVSAKRCMYRRRYVRMCALLGICTDTPPYARVVHAVCLHVVRLRVYVCRAYARANMHVCMHACMCVWRGERRRWAILISLRGLSSTSTFPHRSRLCETFPASHPPPTRPRERTLRVVTFGGHFKPPSSTHPLLIPRSSHIRLCHVLILGAHLAPFTRTYL